MRFLIVLSLFMTFSLVPAMAVGLEDFVGEWKGRGQYTRIDDGERKGKLTCRLKIKLRDSNRITIDGRCGAAIGAKDFAMQITLSGENTLSVLDLSKERVVNRKSTGRFDESGITLVSENEDGSHIFHLSLPIEGQIQMDTSEVTSNKSDTGQVLLKRRK
ncbi:MAG: hypothetical protein COA52_15315 [Hyphomicrobiales bacterium]|nr:hypothetical protein [Hyphomicrobiales bacterium]PCJ86211.1 MAG: hypothetical protein COA52_15315 [Hyphomicrobiales bacterium]